MPKYRPLYKLVVYFQQGHCPTSNKSVAGLMLSCLGHATYMYMYVPVSSWEHQVIVSFDQSLSDPVRNTHMHVLVYRHAEHTVQCYTYVRRQGITLDTEIRT